jgi:outer membrane protein assembly factor BamB
MSQTHSAILLVIGSNLFSAADWPQWGGHDLGRNMYSRERNLPSKVELHPIPRREEFDLQKSTNVKWVAKLGSTSLASPVVSGGRIFIGTNNDVPWNDRDKGDHSILLCLDEKSGDFLWQLVVPKLASGKVNDWESLGIVSTPAAEGDRIYIVTSRCEVLCLTTAGLGAQNVGPFKEESQYFAGPGKPPVKTLPTDADIVWRYDMIDELGVFPHNATRSHVLLIGDYLYINTSNGMDWNHANIPSPNAPSLIVLDKRTGKLVAEDNARISREIFHSQWSSPSAGIVRDRTLICYGGGDGLCYAFDSQPQPGEDGPILPLVWWVDCNPFLYRYKIKDELVTPLKYPQADGPSEIIGTPVFWENRVYVAIGQDPEHGEGLGNLVCIDASGTQPGAKGRILWNYSEINRSLATPAITPDGLLFISDFSGTLYCIDARTARTYWKHDLKAQTWSSPLVADGKVHIGDEDGRFWIFAASREKQLLHQTELFAPIYSTAIAANGVLYINSTTHLFAFALPQSPVSEAPAPEASSDRTR